MQRLWSAVEREDASPPVDLRFIKRPYDRSDTRSAQTRADILSYLGSLYESLAETLPDSKDQTFEDVDAEQMTREALTDSYSILLNQSMQQDGDAPGVPDPVPQVKPPKGRKVRTVSKGVKLNTDRLGGNDSDSVHEIRYLPAGSIKDTWEQYRQISNLDKPAAFPTFWRVSCMAVLQGFGN